jgi:hypothetical protein
LFWLDEGAAKAGAEAAMSKQATNPAR